MQVLPRWRSVLILQNSIIQSATTVTSSSSTRLASFHYTPASFDKRKNKGNPDVRRGQQQSKKHIRFETRQKRADAKQALKDLLFRNGASKFASQDSFSKTDGTSWKTESVDDSDNSDKRTRFNSSTRHASKAKQKKMQRERKHKHERFSDDCDEHPYPETIFRATFGSKWYTWSFNSWKEACSQNSTNGFEWREQSKWHNHRNREWQNESDMESDDESCVVGLSSDRTILGLPPRGPLKIEDVKNAFRSSALKWHPDKHQGPSQAMAEEKFKLCVNAYKSLCGALSSA